MRGWLLTFVLWTTVLWVNARQFNTHWVAAPDTDSLAHVWFRTTLLSSARHREANLTIATTGLVKVYVNEAKVGTALFYPSRPQGDTTAIALTLDVTPYLRPDSNVVAVLYSPGFPHATRRQVSAVFYGIDSKGQRFAYFSDNSWICRHAASGLTADGHEWVDGRWADTPWTASDFDVALWRHAVETTDDENVTAPLRNSKPHPARPTLPASLPRKSSEAGDITISTPTATRCPTTMAADSVASSASTSARHDGASRSRPPDCAIPATDRWTSRPALSLPSDTSAESR